MEITLDLYYENGEYCIYAGADSDSGVSVKGKTAEECANNFKDYLETYLEDGRDDGTYRRIMEIVVQHNGHIDLSDKDITFFDGDTEEQKGESFHVLGLTSDNGNIIAEVDYYGQDKWDVLEELTRYERRILLEELENN